MTRSRLLLPLVALVLVLAGCGSSSGSGSSGTSATLAITVKGGSVTPANKRVKVSLEKGITLVISSDRAGELHVHSSPEQHVEFKAGKTTEKLTFKVPGVIELEEHKTDSLIAQLEVK